MKILNDTPLTFASLRFRLRPPEDSLTLIVKGTFDLVPGAPARIADAPLPPDGDAFADPEAEGSLRYESDFVPFKPRADLLLAGAAHPPAGRPAEACRVSFQVGRVARALAILGDRRWVPGPEGLVGVTDPAPFRSMPLTWERSFGGPGFAANPLGRGADAVSRLARGEPCPLPNIEDPRALIAAPDDLRAPAGFAPLGRGWALRAGKLGTYDDRWLKQRWPWLPEDADLGFFNAAPPELQVEGYLRGDEPLLLESLHPERPRYEARLPGVRARCFLDERHPDASGGRRLREVPLRLDTLWVDPQAGRLVLVWRGVAAVRSPEHDEIDHALVALEPLADERGQPGAQPIAVYEERLSRARPGQEPAEIPPAPPANENEPTGDLDAELAAAMAEAREALRSLGLPPALLAELERERDPDALLQRLIAQMDVDPAEAARIEAEAKERTRKLLADHGHDPAMLDDDGDDGEPARPRLDREAVRARHARGEPLDGEDLSGLDLSGLNLIGARLRGALLAGTRLAGAKLAQADLSAATLAEADLTGAWLPDATLRDADLTAARLEGADLSRATLDGALLDGACLARARLGGASAARASLARADLRAADLEGARLPRANLSRASLDDACLRGADLAEATLEGAAGERVDLDGADLTRLRAAEGARLPGALLRRVLAEGSIWSGADLSGADLGLARLGRADLAGADLEGARLHGADLRCADLTRARLRRARLTRANLFRAVLERADLGACDLRGASLYEAELLDATTAGALLEGADLTLTKLAGRGAG